jgi:hypothetical protein
LGLLIYPQVNTSHFAMSTTTTPSYSGGLQVQTIQDPSFDDARNVVSAEQPTLLSRKVILKLLSAGFSFFVAGTIDGSLGPLIPYMLRNYNVGTSFVSIMYATALHLTLQNSLARFLLLEAFSITHLLVGI